MSLDWVNNEDNYCFNCRQPKGKCPKCCGKGEDNKGKKCERCSGSGYVCNGCGQ